MSFEYKKHVRYWRMCANLLPDAYVSSDASRMSLGFFIVAALDLLDLLHPIESDISKESIITTEERVKWIDWIYTCQTPDGQGFRGFPGTDLGERRNAENQCWDPGNLPNTFFALGSLLILGDDFARVRRRECLDWLSRMQRPDGSFGETLSARRMIEGGRDLRYCCCAAGIVYLLRDPSETTATSTFDESRLIDYILSCRNYNGGYGESPLREPHSGLNYCAIATLELISRLEGPASERAKKELTQSDPCVRWLLDRQTTVLYEEEANGEDQEQDEEAAGLEDLSCGNLSSSHNSIPDVIGFNGRENKIADTCYCFWNSGALSILNSLYTANLSAVRQYLLTKVQHMIGGFAKDTDSPPDVMHSYLGLATLSLFGEANIKPIDAALCMSRSAIASLQHVSWRQHHPRSDSERLQH